jgi:iron complex transport system substrate-binding protein
MRFFFTSLFVCIFLASISLANYPQRIISGIPSATEMLFALGLDERVVGVTTNCNYPPAARQKEKVGGFFLNLEKVVALKPDLIVMLESAQAREIENFKSRQLPVYAINPNSVEEVMKTMLALGEKTGTSARAKAVVAEMKKKMASIKALNANRKKPSVLVAVGYRPLIVAGGNNFIDDVVKYAGGENVAGQLKAVYSQYSYEEIIRQNPDYIIFLEGIVKKDEIRNTPPWQNLSAVREGKLLFIDPDILSRPGPRLVIAIEKIAEFIHGKKT